MTAGEEEYKLSGSELIPVIRRRRMHRNFSPRPVDKALIDDLLEAARRAPSAGHTQATELVVLDGPRATSQYWAVTLPEGDRRNAFRWSGLLAAPMLILVCTRPSAYLARYSEDDKAQTGRGSGVEQWPVPYWWFDAGAVAQNLLLLATEAGLGACLFGPFDHEHLVRAAFDLDTDVRIAAVIALGHSLPDDAGRSAERGWKSAADVIRRVT